MARKDVVARRDAAADLEIDEGVGQTRSRIFDVSNLNNPRYVGEYSSGKQAIDGSGKQVYPGIIDANSVVGLSEISVITGSRVQISSIRLMAAAAWSASIFAFQAARSALTL